MKITSFEPYILAKDAGAVISLLSEMGFEKRHQQDNIADQSLTGVMMSHKDGFKATIVQTNDLPRDSVTGIRVNVGDFEEAYDLLTAKGFKKAPGTDIVNTGSAKALLMMAPSGFLLELIHHIRKENIDGAAADLRKEL